MMGGNEMKNFTWDQCKEKADAFIEQLLKDGHSGQDIVFIGGQLFHAGIFVENRNAKEFVKEHPWNQEEVACPKT
jgi:hypothetical protein